MRDMKKHERRAIEAVAKQFSATWKKGSGIADAYLNLDGRPVAVEIATLKQPGTGRGNAAKPHLRFDKVATRVIQHLRDTAGETAPTGVTVLVTITAPIRLPSKTTAALEDKMQNLLCKRLPGRDEEDTIHGNRVRIRLIRAKSGRVPKMIGFVHNPETDSVVLFDMTRELLDLFGARAREYPPGLAADRWLVVVSARGISCLEAYRYIYSQLRLATGLEKIVVVFADGRVGVLTE